MNSRSSWLQRTRDYAKSIQGRKYFIIHKNQHNLELAADSSLAKSPTTEKSLKSIKGDHSSHTPLPQRSSISPVKLLTDDKNLTLKLKEKDNEIKLLRQLYDETNRKLQSVEQTRKIEGNLKILDTGSPSVRERKIVLPEIERNTRFTENEKLLQMPEFEKMRNKSTPNNKPYLYIDLQHSLFNQPKFTKSRPKLVLSNPITGIAPSLSQNRNFY
jgi:hypothetical protein